jgi:AraC family transcriptional regulator, melibiose operon regulatory protein
MVKFDPKRPDYSPYGFTCVRWWAAKMPRPNHHNEIEINYIVSGSVTYLLGGRKVRLDAGHLHAFWAAMPHQVIEVGHDTDYFVATIPLAWFLQFNLPENLTLPIMQGDVVRDPCEARSDFDHACFSQWENDLQLDRAVYRDIVLIELEARLRRVAHALPPCSNDAKSHDPIGSQTLDLNNIELMACTIARRYREPLSVEEISDVVRLHPNYAMKVFKRALGTTLMDFLTHNRVSHAQRLLTTTNEKIAVVSEASGFTSLSRFNESFRRTCGCTPKEYRLEYLGAQSFRD